MTDILQLIKNRDPGEKEFHQAVYEVIESVKPVLDRSPEYRKAAVLERITEPEQMLAKAGQMEEESAKSYNSAAIECSANADSVSKQMFEKLVQDEERHFDEFDKQLHNIKRFGVSYLALQSFNRPPEEGSPGTK